ncbi:hypothetical protein Drorol1_Dr00013654 [Drosera rotundifolia]
MAKHHEFPYLKTILLCCMFLLIKRYANSSPGESSTYIVHMDKSYMPNVFTSHHHWYSSIVGSLESTNASILYSYDVVLHGFSATLSLKELQTLKNHPAFISASVDRKGKLDTTRTVEFMSLNPNTGLWPVSKYGKDVIVGVIDTGVWPESRSFGDHGIGPVPARWKGICEAGQEFNASMCNRKLIGARYFNKGAKAAEPGIEIAMESARDIEGHGSHTASTAVGNYVDEASFFGYANGMAKGVAPFARLAVYKASWLESKAIYSSDVLAAFEQALSDGVDVISVSFGFDGAELYEDPVAIGSFAAMENGVLVSLSAGNGGAAYATLHNGIPWAMTVGASTIDRQFAGTLTLGNGETIVGWTLFPSNAMVQNVSIVYNETLAKCDSSDELAELRDVIIVCDSEKIPFKSQMELIENTNIAAAIFINNDPAVLEQEQVTWPGIVVSPREGSSVLKYAKGSATPLGSIQFQQTIVGSIRAPAVAYYSSRGPSRSYAGVLKPDIMAPGSRVLAAWVPYIAEASIGSISLLNDYVLKSGTSMACPHASGVAALLKGAHPEWSAAAIRSAMMTTAKQTDNSGHHIRDSGKDYTPASPLAMGSGQADPNRALDPGLIYDVTPQDYVNLICSMNFTRNQTLSITRSSMYNCTSPSSDLNYPSFIAWFSSKSSTTLVRTFHRTVTNVGDRAARYSALLTTPKGCTLSVSPEVLVFKNKYEKQSYSLRIQCNKNDSNLNKVFDGSLNWVDDVRKHSVRSPIVACSPP